jgi:hypothetical protein
MLLRKSIDIIEKIFVSSNNCGAGERHDHSPENLDSYVFLGKIF